MKRLRIVWLIALFTGVGVSSSAAVSKPPVVSAKAHAESTIGAKRVTLGSEQSPLRSKRAHVCSVMQGVSYGTALVGLQSVLIVLPSFASGVGVPVAAIATGVGIVSSGVGFVSMVVHDVICK